MENVQGYASHYDHATDYFLDPWYIATEVLACLRERRAVLVYSALEALGMILPLLCITLPVSLIISLSLGIGPTDAMEHGMTVKGVSARSDVWQQRSWLCLGGHAEHNFDNNIKDTDSNYNHYIHN